MQYALMMIYPEPAEGEISDEDMQAAMAAFDAYADAMAKAGVLLAVDVLQPSTASTTVSAKDGTLKIQDGPFADTKEKIGGIFTIDVPDLDAALAWAEKNPAAQWGTIEVRPSAMVYRDGAWLPST
jgi:hypothetical protein